MDFYGTMLLKKANNEDISLLGANSLALKKCLENTLTTITEDMLDGASEIRAYAFYKCSHLEGVEIPSSVVNIGNYSFYDCTGLENVTIQQGVTNIGESVFRQCSSLKSITIPEGVTTIQVGTFYDCTSLKSVTLPNGLETIMNETFVHCDLSGEELVIPDGVTRIGYSAFFGSKVKNATIGYGVTNIENSVFNSCAYLENVTIPSSVTNITSWSFNACSSLKSVTVLATNPPTLNNNVFNGAPNNFLIYVPAGSVDAYKSASRWSSYGNRIQAIPS